MAGDDELALTEVGDLPEVCLAHAIALTSPHDACRCAAVSPAFRAAADSDHVWRRFLPPSGHRGATVLLSPQGQGPPPKRPETSKDAYLRLCDTSSTVVVDGEGNGSMVIVATKTAPACLSGCLGINRFISRNNGLDIVQSMWLDKASGGWCYMLSARALSLPWDDGEFSWRWTPHPLSRFFSSITPPFPFQATGRNWFRFFMQTSPKSIYEQGKKHNPTVRKIT
jgi:hypothetical protein